MAINNTYKSNFFERNKSLTSAFIFLLLALATDFSVAGIFLKDQKTDDLRFRSEHYYFHHTLLPNVDCEDIWFDVAYRMTTDSSGFKSEHKPSAINKSNKRVLLIGDSFAEGIGIAYPETFAGILETHSKQAQILNAGVASYSPRLYFLKTKFLLEKQKFSFNELVVFLDISDPQDEIIYRTFNFSEDMPLPPSRFQSWQRDIYVFLVNNSFVWNRIHRIAESSKLAVSEPYLTAKTLGYQNFEAFWEARDKWTFDSLTWCLWGEEGMELALANMDRLSQLCKKHSVKFSLVVYPWVGQIRRNEINCPQVYIWEEFAKAHEIRFINLFPAF